MACVVLYQAQYINGVCTITCKEVPVSVTFKSVFLLVLPYGMRTVSLYTREVHPSLLFLDKL